MLVLRLLGLLLDVLVAPVRLFARRRLVPRGSFVHVVVDGAVVDILAKPRFWQLRAQKALSLYDLASVVDFAIADPDVRGLLVTIKTLAAGMASAASLRELLVRARDARKEVVVHLPLGGGTKEIFVATGATSIVSGPAAQLAPLGFASRTRYVKRALDKAGIVPEVYACGEYKSAGESLVRDSMSDAQREQLGAILDRFDEALVQAIAEGRRVPPEEARAIIDNGPYFGHTAVSARLADAAAYEDELPKILGLPKADGDAPGTPVHGLVPWDSYLSAKRRPLFRALRRPPAVGVIRVHGAIAHAASSFAELATDDKVARMVHAARLDRRVKGVILHIDSPGGSALASDRMHHEIAQLAREKPVVACMANVAASGGYYVAAPAHRIVAQSVTITGSIGVVGARLGLEPLMDKLGVTTETIRRGARAGLLSPSAPLDDDERRALMGELETTYRNFVRVVAQGRKMSLDDVEVLARGRVYSGSAAKAVGLVDVLGGFDAALHEVKAMMPSDVSARAKPVVLRGGRQPLAILWPPSEGESGRRALSSLLGALLPPAERALVLLAHAGERVLTLWTGGLDGLLLALALGALAVSSSF